MPLPNPSSYKSQNDYIGPCMSAQKGEDREQDQKLAICYSKWRRKDESNIIEKINSLIGDETTTAGVATNTAGCGYPMARRKKKKNYKVTESAKSPKKGDRFKYKGKMLTILSVGSGMDIDKYIEVQFDKEKYPRSISMKNFFKGNEFKYVDDRGLREKQNTYVYMVHKRKGKEQKVPNNPEVIKKYKEKGFELKEDIGKFYDKRKKQGAKWHELKCKKCKNEWIATDKKSKCPACGKLSESIYGATLAGTGIQGSGQTRSVGSFDHEVMNLNKPVHFDDFTGHFMPNAAEVDADEIAVNVQKETPPEIEVVERISHILGEEVRWKYKDARGVWQTGVVVNVSDFGGTDIVYQFKNDRTGKIDVVSGSRLKDAKALYGKPKTIKRGK